MPETDDPKDMTSDDEKSTVVINGEVLGNTQYAARLIAASTGGNLFRIETKKPYPRKHRELLGAAGPNGSHLRALNFPPWYPT